MNENQGTPLTEQAAQGNTAPSPGTPLRTPGKTLLGTYLLLLAIVIAYLLVRVWPEPTTALRTSLKIIPGVWEIEVTSEVRLLLLVLICGALGSYVHAASSFARFVGNRSIVSSWIWWYVLRPFVGMGLAASLYFVIRGGFMSGSVSPEETNIFGFAAMASMAGMFSKQAIMKLKELFDFLFTLNKKSEDADPIPGKSGFNDTQ